MTKLAQTLGLTEFQTEIMGTVRQFVEKEVIPTQRCGRGDGQVPGERVLLRGHPAELSDSRWIRLLPRNTRSNG